MVYYTQYLLVAGCASDDTGRTWADVTVAPVALPYPQRTQAQKLLLYAADKGKAAGRPVPEVSSRDRLR